MSYDPTDPLSGGEKTPAVSWKDQPIGTTVVLSVTEGPKLVQSRDFDTGEPAFWPAGSDGVKNPKMSVVVAGQVNGEDVALWAPKPSSMFAALAAAQIAAGSRIVAGGTVRVTLCGQKKNPERPKLNAQNLFEATYLRPDAFASDTPVTTPAATPPPAAPTGPDPAALMAELRKTFAPWAAAGIGVEQIAVMGNSLLMKNLIGEPLSGEFVAAVLA